MTTTKAIFRNFTVRLNVILLFMILGGLVSCSGNSTASVESRVTKGILQILNVKESSLSRVKAGLSMVDERSLQSSPDKTFRKKFLVKADQVDGSPVYILSPRDSATRKVIFYLHGGAYSVGFGKIHWDFFAWLLENTGATIVAPDYPLPPASDWVKSWAMVRQSYEGLFLTDPDAEVILMGDSAGGGFALALAQELVLTGRPLPEKLILLSPWLDITMTDPSRESADAEDPILNGETLKITGSIWAGKTDPADWHLSPLYGPLEKMPPIILFTGTADILNPDAQRLKAKLELAGAPLWYFEYPEMMHVWMLFDFPESVDAKSRLLRLW